MVDELSKASSIYDDKSIHLSRIAQKAQDALKKNKLATKHSFTTEVIESSSAIGNSLHKYIDVATETALDVGVNVGANEQILEFLRQEPRLSAKELATLLNKTTRTIERRLKMLREEGRLKRVGSDKAGHWEIIERPS